MTDNELLLSLSNMLDEKLKPIQLTQENEIIPRLQNIENCYTSTYNRYSKGINQLNTIQTDVDILKKVVTEHSEKLQKIS
ncbi:MAG: hypothetical protein E7261_01945 [Lachnospiraceae bacterium]|nr:hypothetical protein [Lachnospiraceae bacterium]